MVEALFEAHNVDRPRHKILCISCANVSTRKKGVVTSYDDVVGALPVPLPHGVRNSTYSMMTWHKIDSTVNKYHFQRVDSEQYIL